MKAAHFVIDVSGPDQLTVTYPGNGNEETFPGHLEVVSDPVLNSLDLIVSHFQEDGPEASAIELRAQSAIDAAEMACRDCEVEIRIPTALVMPALMACLVTPKYQPPELIAFAKSKIGQLPNLSAEQRADILALHLGDSDSGHGGLHDRAGGDGDASD
ncbi:MAG: hypothetical protein AAFX06_19970 [Planctomycetota bacterium]